MIRAIDRLEAHADPIINPSEETMIAKLSTWLGSIAKGWLVLIFFVADGIFSAVIMPGAQAKLEALSGGVGPLDLTFFPSAEKVLAAIVAYGAEGRPLYANIELTADIIYPIVYTFFFSLLMTYLLQRAFDKDSKLQRLNVLPFGAWAFDMLENVCILTLLFSFPAQSALMAFALGLFNGIKWLFAGASILSILVALITWIYKKIAHVK
jgi:hypothetical protein